MMKKIIFILMLFLVCQNSYAQSDNISNVKWDEDLIRDEVIITYDLEEDGKYDFYNISVQFNIDNNLIDIADGDLSNHKKVETGTGNKIKWFISDEHKGLPTNTVFLLTADRIKAPKDSAFNIKPIAWTGVCVGLASSAYGLYKMIPARDQYDNNYVAKTNPDDPFYYRENELTRNQYYDQVNQEYKNGSAFLIAGAVVMVTSGVLLFLDKKKKQKKEMNKLKTRKERRQDKNDLSIYPYYQPSLKNTTSSQLGVHLSYTF